MTEYAPEQPYRLRVPNESNTVRVIVDAVFRPVQNANRFWEHPEGHTVSSQRGSIIRTIQPYTDEELRMIEEADQYPPDLRKQVRTFLEG
jgi:hypothetical protein